ncbi:MAG TPA: AraC family transcriptional regulator [Clostridiaceae bacterium]
MDSINYEPHIHDDPSFPIIFHLDYIKRGAIFLTHWHESMEILFVIEGSITVLSDAKSITANKEDIVIINSNNIHHIQSLEEISEYYCLIIDKKLCEEFGLYIEEIVFERLIKDKTCSLKFNVIKNELLQKKVFYKAAVKSAIIDLLIHFYRGFTLSESPLSNKLENSKIEIIKKSIKYIRNNYNKSISTADAALEIGLSKSYFCRIFKEITGYTPVFYINYIRCFNGKKLFQSGKYTVSEVALLCGFDNLSYFSKIYKKHMGCLPSLNKKGDSL